MATALTMQRDEIIQLALELVGSVAVGVTASAALVSSSAKLLNMIIKELDAEYSISEKLAMFQTSATVTTNDTYVAIAADTEFVMAAYYAADAGGTKIPMKPMTLRQMMETRGETDTTSTTELWYACSKTDAGTYPPATSVTTPVLFFWPYIPAAGKVWYWARKKIDLFDNASDTNDLPSEFLRYTTLQLAADVAPLAGAPLQAAQYFDGKAQQAFSRLLAAQSREYRQLLTDQPNAENDKVV